MTLKLNLGCGDVLLDGYVNVDLREDCGADLVSDVGALPYEDGTVEHIVAHDILEHVDRPHTVLLLAEWARVLQPFGLLTVRCPNLLALGREIATHNGSGNLATVDLIVNNIYGGHRWGPDGAWDTHHWGFTPETLERDLRTHGFVVEANDRALNMTVDARKVA